MEPLAFRKLQSKTCVRRSGEEKVLAKKSGVVKELQIGVKDIRCQSHQKFEGASGLMHDYDLGVNEKSSKEILKEALGFDDCKWTAVYALLGDIGDISTGFASIRKISF
ncbi:hypothetical protein Sjap_011147 [Stephania japonica]|uniref:Uncharacterized protein n=1 Tax=Stephania japonica TaxID=461633 RepID=A0AAP0P755_9MAGN